MNLFDVKLTVCLSTVCLLAACSAFDGAENPVSAKHWQNHANTIATVKLPSTMQSSNMKNYYDIPAGKDALVGAAATAATAPVFVPPGSQFKGGK